LDRRGWKRVFEPAHEKADLFIEQSVAREIRLYLLQRNAQKRVGFPVDVLRVLLVAPIGLRQALEGVGHPEDAVPASIGFQNSAHENAGAAAPDAGFDQVSGDIILQHLLDAILHIFEAFQANHGFRARGPVLAFEALGRVEGRLDKKIDLLSGQERLENRVQQPGEVFAADLPPGFDLGVGVRKRESRQRLLQKIQIHFRGIGLNFSQHFPRFEPGMRVAAALTPRLPGKSDQSTV